MASCSPALHALPVAIAECKLPPSTSWEPAPVPDHWWGGDSMLFWKWGQKNKRLEIEEKRAVL